MGMSVTRRSFLGTAVAGGATLRLSQEGLTMTDLRQDQGPALTPSHAIDRGGFSQARLARMHEAMRRHRRRRPAPRPRHARPPARPGARGRDRHPGLRRQRADAARHDLPARLHDEADHGGRRHDPRGGMQAQARRSGRRMAAGAEGPQGPADDREPARRHGAREAPDHAARPAHVSLGLRRSGLHLADVPPPEGDGGGTAALEHMAVRRHTRRVHAGAWAASRSRFSRASDGCTT